MGRTRAKVRVQCRLAGVKQSGDLATVKRRLAKAKTKAGMSTRKRLSAQLVRTTAISGSSSEPLLVLDFHGMRKARLMACATRLGVRTRRPSARAGYSPTWRKVRDVVVDCEKAACCSAQPMLESFFKMNRPASACMSNSPSRIVSAKIGKQQITARGLCLDVECETPEARAKHRKSVLISALRDIKRIVAFRKQARALNLVVRVPKAAGEGYRWRTKADILADYVRMLEESPCASPLAPPEGRPVSKLLDL